jgi:hypothetical protein
MGVIVALELTDGAGKVITTKQQAVVELVRLAAPCAKKQLLAMGVDANETTKLVAALTVVKAVEAAASEKGKAIALYHALLPLLRGEMSEATAMGVIVALELQDGAGEPIESKEQVAMEAVRMLAPCIERKLVEKGVPGGDVAKVAKAVKAAAIEKDKAIALYHALLPVLQGKLSESAMMDVIVALELTDGAGKPINSEEQVAMEVVRMMAPCIESKLAEKGVSGVDVATVKGAVERVAKHKEQAIALYHALLPVLQGKLSESTVMGVVMALELKDANGEPIASKKQVAMEVVRVMAPCIKRKLEEQGADAAKVMEAVNRVAGQQDEAMALYRALVPMMRGDLSESTVIGVFEALGLAAPLGLGAPPEGLQSGGTGVSGKDAAAGPLGFRDLESGLRTSIEGASSDK